MFISPVTLQNCLKFMKKAFAGFIVLIVVESKTTIYYINKNTFIE